MSDSPRPPVAVLRLGVVSYRDAFALQRKLVEARVAGEIEDTLLLLQHPPTITHSFTGRGAEHLLAAPELLERRGVVVETTDRGGDITFHGPGQVVGYPVIALDADRGERDLHRYLRWLEDVLIRAAASFGVETVRVEGRTGTWLPDGSRKLAAIGVKATRWVTLHGFALNVATDLSYFDLIVPCGIQDAGIINLGELVEREGPSVVEAEDALEHAFGEVFGRRPSPPSAALSILLSAVRPNPSPVPATGTMSD